MRTGNNPGFGQLRIINKPRKSQLCGIAGDRASFHGFKIEPRGKLQIRGHDITGVKNI